MTAVAERIREVEAGYVFEAQGLYVTKELSTAEWRAIGVEIGRRASGVAWQLGDWLIAGGRRKTKEIVDGQEWGKASLYREAVHVTGFGEAHLASCYAVSTAFPRGRRAATLSWSHHRELLRIVDADQRRNALEMSVRQHLTREALVRWIEAQFPDRTPPRSGRPVTNPTKRERRARVRCPHCTNVFEVHGHKVRWDTPVGIAPTEADVVKANEPFRSFEAKS